MKSRRLKELSGTARPDREKSMKAPPGQTLVPEKWLNKAMKDNFEALRQLYVDAQVPFYTVDSKILSLFCFWMAVIQFYSQIVSQKMTEGNKMALLQESDNGYVNVNSEYAIIKNATDIVVKLSKVIGITPGARSKIEDFMNATAPNIGDDEF